MTREEVQELLSGYALNIIEDDERQEVENFLQDDAGLRAELAELDAVVNDLLWLPNPNPMPEGHLNRLREKAGVEISNTTSTSAATTLPEGHLDRLRQKAGVVEPRRIATEEQVIPASVLEQARQRRAGRAISPLTWASGVAALLLVIVVAVLALQLIDANNRANSSAAARQDVISLLGSKDLQVTALQATPDGKNVGTARLLANPANNQALLVVENWGSLPTDKEYEVWLLDASGKPYGVGLFSQSSTVVSLKVPGEVEQYGTVAVTAEPKGGSTAPTAPILSVGKITT